MAIPAQLHAKSKGAVSMQIIADQAGVSKMTVSLALRDSPLITKETKDRVQAVAKELNYRPNPLVTTLMAQMGGRKVTGGNVPLAVLYETIYAQPLKESEVLRPIQEGIVARAEELGFSAEMFLMHSDETPKKQRLDRIFRTRNIRGIIVLPVGLETRSMDFPWEHYASVAVGNSLKEPNLHRVALDDFSNTWLAMENIHSMGYRRPGLLLAALADARSNYHVSAAYWHYLKLNPHLQGCDIFPHVAGTEQKALAAWFKKWKPDVFLSHGDHRASLNAAGAAIPEKRGFVGINWHDNDPEIAAVLANYHLLGEAAVEAVAARLHRNDFGLPRHPRTLVIPGTWHDGSSTTSCPRLREITV